MTRRQTASLAPAQDDGFDDDFDSYLDSRLSDPTFAAAYEDAAQRARVVADLVECRRAQDLKQRQIAEHMGIGQSQVSEFENSSTDTYFSTLQRYARSVGARLVVKIELPAEQKWADHPRSYRAHQSRTGEQTVVKEPDSTWLADWVSQAKPVRDEVRVPA